MGLGYSDEECRLWRWVDSHRDQEIQAVATKFAGLGEMERNTLRDDLSMDDFYSLLTFARRSALAALRGDGAGRIETAFYALAMIAFERIDYRDILVANWQLRYAGQRRDMRVDLMAHRAARLAESETAKALLRDLHAKIDLAQACGYKEVSTPAGAALFQTGYRRFSPQADLAAIAFACAVALENGGYKIGTLEVACDLPSVWLACNDGSQVSTLINSLTGCVSITGAPCADPNPKESGQSLLMFVAEAANEDAAREIASAAQCHSGPMQSQIGMASGRLCAIIIQWSWMADTPPLVDVTSLERLRSEVQRFLA